MKLLGVMGDRRVLKSLSPRMHNAVLSGLGIAACYLPFPVAPELVGPAVAGLRALGALGANVTVPHKQAVIPHLDRLSPRARRLGAVNTIVNRQGSLEGHNTDVEGFARALAQSGHQAREREVLVLGAGGAARAVVAALAEQGPRRLWVAARDRQAAARLAAELGGEPLSLAQAPPAAARAHILINATSVSSPREGPELARLVQGLEPLRCRLVMDLNYGRPDNLWSHLAARLGCHFLDGLPMLAQQARLSFLLWTGQEPPLEQFLRPLEEGP